MNDRDAPVARALRCGSRLAAHPLRALAVLLAVALAGCAGCGASERDRSSSTTASTRS